MKKARALYIPAGGKKAVWGPVDHNVLPEGYPYKEKSEVVLFEQEITTNENGAYLAGLNFIDLEIGKEYVVTFGGVNYPCVADSFSMIPYLGNAGIINPELAGTDPFVIVPAESGAIVLPDFANQTVNVKISAVSETIHPMAREFLPADVGGGVQVVTLTGDDSGGSMVYTSSHTGAEIAEMARNGAVIANLVTPDGGNNIAAYAGSYMGFSSFIAALVAGGKAAINAFVVSENDTTVTGGIMT